MRKTLSDVDEGKRLDDAAAEEEEEEEESDQDEYSSDDDNGVENVDSDDNADNVSKDDGSLGVPPLEEMIQFMLTLSKGNHDHQIDDALKVDSGTLYYVHSITTHHSDIDRYIIRDERNAVGLEYLKERLRRQVTLQDRQSFKLKWVRKIEEELVVWRTTRPLIRIGRNR